MQAVIFCGIQATGKSTFCRSYFFDTHIRINLDMLRTRWREDVILRACIQAKQPFVVDNTNPTPADRARYIRPAKEARFEVIGYYFPATAEEALQRNAQRPPRERIPIPGIRGCAKRLIPPTLAEGFDALYEVTIDPAGGFQARLTAGQQFAAPRGGFPPPRRAGAAPIFPNLPKHPSFPGANHSRYTE